MGSLGTIIFLALATLANAKGAASWAINGTRLELSSRDSTLLFKQDLGTTHVEGAKFSNRNVEAVVSKDQTHALVFSQDKLDENVEHDEGPITSNREARYYDSSGKMLWDRKDVSNYWISKDNLVLLLITAPNGCSEEVAPPCTDLLASLNDKGEEILHIGPSPGITHVWVSENGVFGGADVIENAHRFVFFKTSDRTPSIKLEKLPEGVKVKDNGVVEFSRPIYAAGNGKDVLEFVRTEVVESLRIK
jgi:hypothetical protein